MGLVDGWGLAPELLWGLLSREGIFWIWISRDKGSGWMRDGE